MNAITIRPEAGGDQTSIFALTKTAFADQPFSDGSEPHIINRLRDAGELTLSLVAEDAERIVGHIAFSPVTISNGARDWYGLGPVCVWPDLQGKGIGGALVRQGIAELREHNAAGIVLLGSPEYYARFGFEHDPVLTYPGPPAEYFQRLVLEGDPPSGHVSYARSFG